ncbi:MAG: GntR family transcriptional regulator, transcriptional repressor for pyruvate dehydrogenase complex [Solirubrobacteraceae bacterium]
MARKHRDVMSILIADIVSGVRPAGDMLPREVDLAAEFDVSRGVARETIRAMEERGLISVKHGKGATINEADEWDVFDPDVLAATLDSERGSEVLAEYLECRRILEVEAAGMAAERAAKRDVANLAAAMQRMEEATARPPSQAAEERFHEADIAFHQALIAATGNRALGGLVDRIHSALLLARFPLARPDYREEIALPEHRRILEAVTSGDGDGARQAMSDHLDTIAGYLDEHRGQRRARRRRTPAAASST